MFLFRLRGICSPYPPCVWIPADLQPSSTHRLSSFWPHLFGVVALLPGVSLLPSLTPLELPTSVFPLPARPSASHYVAVTLIHKSPRSLFSPCCPLSAQLNSRPSTIIGGPASKAQPAALSSGQPEILGL